MIDFCLLARSSLQYWLDQGQYLKDEQRAGLRAGCFVSYHHPEDGLRGCIGTIEPTCSDLVEEIIGNAVAAGTRDPRFASVDRDELPLLRVEVSVLNPPSRIHGPKELDPSKYGVIVQSGSRRGLLLPDLPGIESVGKQLTIAKQKAGIALNENVVMWRFTVEKHHEERQA